MNMPTAQVSYPVIYIYFEPSRSTWLTSDS
jgi:hypothetical protein